MAKDDWLGQGWDRDAAAAVASTARSAAGAPAALKLRAPPGVALVPEGVSEEKHVEAVEAALRWYVGQLGILLRDGADRRVFFGWVGGWVGGCVGWGWGWGGGGCLCVCVWGGGELNGVEEHHMPTQVPCPSDPVSNTKYILSRPAIFASY